MLINCIFAIFLFRLYQLGKSRGKRGEMAHRRVIATVLFVSLCASLAAAQTTLRIGGVLSSRYHGNVLNESVRKLNRNTNASFNLSFDSFSVIMDSNPIRSALNLCDQVIPKRVHVVIVSKPPDGDSSPISVSYTCGFYQIPVIGISARDSAFSDTVSLNFFLWTQAYLKHYGISLTKAFYSKF